MNQNNLEITFQLNPGEANAILQVLGQLPTQSNAYPLYNKLKEQYVDQMPQEEVKTDQENEDNVQPDSEEETN